LYYTILDLKQEESPDDVAALSSQCVLVRVCSYVYFYLFSGG